MTKFCTRCKEEKKIIEFYKNKYNKDGLEYCCKECYSILRKSRAKRYREKNKNKIKQYQQEYRKTHKQERHEHYMKNRDKYIKQSVLYQKNKRNNNIKFKIYELFRKKILLILKHKKEKRTRNFLGCSIKEFKNWLGIIGDSYDSKKYHIDHIIPCSLYNLSKESEQKKCFNYRNMRLISAKENLSKSNKLDLELVDAYNIGDLLPTN